MIMYYDREGEPMTMLAWAERLADREYAVVRQDRVRGWLVSTVWLGLDHGLWRGGPPVIFETMIFPPGDEAGGESVWSGDYQERYPTEGGAQAGHDRAMAWLTEKLGPEIELSVMESDAKGKGS